MADWVFYISLFWLWLFCIPLHIRECVWLHWAHLSNPGYSSNFNSSCFNFLLPCKVTGEGNGTPLQYSWWKIPWTEEPGGLQSMRSLRVGHDWETSLSLFTFMHWRRKWQPTPVFLPGESQGRGAWWAAVYRVSQSWTRLKQLSSSSSSKVTCTKSRNQDTRTSPIMSDNSSDKTWG